VADAGRTQAHERLRRLLLLVPYVSKHPGLTVDEVAKALGLTREGLLEDLDLLTLVGRPPFSPDDYVDVYVEDDRVWVDLDQRLSTPPRLTAAEGVALAAAAALLGPRPGDALHGALAKLEQVLPKGAREQYRALAQRLDLAADAPPDLAALSQAVVEHREVALDYFTAGTGVTERRVVQPHELFSHRGTWYLSAHCLTRGDERLFRLDRIAKLELTEQRFEAPAKGAGRPVPPESREQGARVRFSPKLSAWVQERFGAAASVLPGGAVEVEIRDDNEAWLTRWVLSFGGEAVVVAPESARAAIAKAAGAAIGLES